jgi:hypothetical protein
MSQLMDTISFIVENQKSLFGVPRSFIVFQFENTLPTAIAVEDTRRIASIIKLNGLNAWPSLGRRVTGFGMDFARNRLRLTLRAAA